MRNNYFEKLLNYMKSVYHIDKSLSRLTDGRVSPTYKTTQVMQLVLLSFLLRIRSFNELNNMIKGKEFNRLFPRGMPVPRIDTIRDTLKVMDLEGLRQANNHIVKKAIENKVFENGTIDGYTVAALDGTRFFGSGKKNCPECLRSNGQNFHSGVVMSTVGDGPKLVIDVVVYDALACNSIWFNNCIKHGVDTIVRAKNNYNRCLKQVKSYTNKSEPVAVWENERGFERVDVYESLFEFDNVYQPLRFIKFAIKYPDNTRTQIMIVTACMAMRLKTLFKIIRARWDIENSIFNNLKKECGLGRRFVHGGKAVEAVQYLMFIASNIMRLFFNRRLKKLITTQRELVRLLFKGLYLFKYNAELIYDSA